MPNKTFLSKEIENLTQDLNKEIKVLENTLQYKHNLSKSLITLNKDIQNSLTQLSQVVEELLFTAPEQIQMLQTEASNVLKIDFDSSETINSSYEEKDIFVLFEQLNKQYKNCSPIERDKAYQYLDWLELQCQKEIRQGDSLSDVSRRHSPKLQSMLKAGEIPSIPTSRLLSKETTQRLSYEQDLADYRNRKNG